MIAEEITVEWDEGGCLLHVDGETWRVADPEALYDRVKAAILPWLMEKWDAEQSFNAAYAAEEFARYHDRMSEIWDSRAGK